MPVAPLPDAVPRAESAFREPVVERERTRALVLLFHAFDRGPDPLSVDSQRLDEHIIWMRSSHIEIIALSQLLRFLDGELALPARVAVITIDDGDESVYRSAWPVLRRHAVPFALGLPTKLMEERHPRLMRWEHIREMLDSGLCDLASHGHEHKSIVHFGDRQAIAQLDLSKRILNSRTGRSPDAFFYPLGVHDDRTARLPSEAGFRAAFTASGAAIALQFTDRFRIPRVGIQHPDTRATLAWYFSDTFLMGRATGVRQRTQ
ncbi:MAG: polysaccharide deacetylase family protein [Polyangiaceae bacterium]|nr:polysaccharide deacetylase family protein [Polyangiaceae bacterium]